VTNRYDQIREESFKILEQWIESCTRLKNPSRNTISVGIVVLDHLRDGTPMVEEEEVVSDGGEIRGSRSGLDSTLEKYGIRSRYLKEVTTRQGHQDGQRLFELFEWGRLFEELTSEKRDKILTDLIEVLARRARAWLQRQNLKFDLDRRKAPTAWIGTILDKAEGRSGGVVEQHLVGAKLSKRYEERDDIEVENQPAHAADVQTQRPGDFALRDTVYHVTGSPSPAVIEKCRTNLKTGKSPVLLVPRKRQAAALQLAENANLGDAISVLAIEDFLAINIIELSDEANKEQFETLQEILEVYNARLEEVETDMSLRIEVK
jgi:hypothetical protein